jgi:hypothetical protein
MAAAPTTSTQDLRAQSQDYKRDSESKHKWEHGQAWGSGRQLTAHSRPARTVPKYVFPESSRINRSDLTRRHRVRRSNKELGLNQAKLAQRRDIHEEQSSSSCDDDEIIEPSAAPEPDAEIAYSYDASRGPSQGSQVLGFALAKAVERFENNATDKLVKDEYEVLNSDGEPVVTQACKKGSKSNASKDDDEYEFV